MKELQSGRSMIEMLGVLAIIGVLSIGGLYAYRQAMGRYWLNEALRLLTEVDFSVKDFCDDNIGRCSMENSSEINLSICQLIDR